MNSLKNVFSGSLAAVVLSVATVLPVAAADGSLSIPISTVVRGDAGSTHLLAQQEVEQDLRGMVCDIEATGENQKSVHPGNDIVIASGSDNVVLEDVERAANVITQADGQLTLGDDITVTLVMGDDRVFSGGMNLEFTCEEPKDEQIEVCRDGVIVTIDPEDRKDSDTNAPCVLGEEDMPKVLPNTGIGGALSGVFGASAMGVGLKSWLESRTMLKTGALRKEQ